MATLWSSIFSMLSKFRQVGAGQRECCVKNCGALGSLTRWKFQTTSSAVKSAAIMPLHAGRRVKDPALVVGRIDMPLGCEPGLMSDALSLLDKSS